ncbi:hypothetical protein [Globicatella sp. PHS-GS-PNBC-21-1553]|uniref:hypothetical protein n=1 Tax=Globicatella sp. PHS-GS-PNBC-21-1553 TaxID=2885764 RepID=UPI00298EFE79|nr:hypothetical protein [Globicatella sp. PHS-GS-PNBC-21-1553]WPC07981.1 hypothetical protein LB888_07955 [Globicatella sp. PHS-GS-PNBC-21-1553]
MKEFKTFKEVLGLVLIAGLVFTYLIVGIIRMGGFNEERERREQMCKVIDARLIESGLVNCNDGK